MVNEDYVSYEVAELLKEKGFNEPIRCWYDNAKDFHESGVKMRNSDCINLTIMCPTHQMAMKWLREKGIYIQIRRNINTYLYGAMMLKDGSDIYATIPSELETYKETVEAALKYCLEKLDLIMKSYTDLEQSKKLAEILSFESVDMYYKYVLPKSDRIIHTPEIGNPIDSLKWYNEGYTFRGREPITLSEYCIPCWSLALLLSVLDFPSLTQNKEDEWEVCIPNHKSEGYIEVSADNPVDACVEMIMKLHELKML